MKRLRSCKNGHQYYKSSDCPTCPVCEDERKPNDNFLSLFAAPARRALENEGINSPKQFEDYSEKEILKLHGVGPGSIVKIQEILKREGLKLRET